MGIADYKPLAQAGARESLFWLARVSAQGRTHVGVLEGQYLMTRCGMWLERGRCFVKATQQGAPRPAGACQRCWS